MDIIRVYVDTSVFGGTQDDEFAEVTRRFFKRVLKGLYIVMVSAETLRELAKAPSAVRSLWESLPADGIEEVPTSEQVKALANEYIKAGVLGPGSASDALHVACATTAGADLILSWNFRHIVNFDRIRGFNRVNVMNGYGAMTILSPLEIGGDDEG